MKILLVTDEIWNDRVNGNNVLQNWFEGMPGVEIAQIGCLPVKPFNIVCTRYFRLTDSQMVRSLFGRRAGESFEISVEEMAENPQTVNYIAQSRFYSTLKKISGPALRIVRDIVWSVGRYNKQLLKQFIDDFKPDVVFCPRMLSWKMMRLEKQVAKLTDAPFIAFTADDEASFRERNFSPLFWINRYFFHRAFKRHIPLYRHYYTFSEDQSREYREEYGVETSELYKCGVFPEKFTPKPVGNPIRMVYAGKLYCNRWKSLAQIGLALREINRDGVKIVLDIFTPDSLTDKQRKVLSSNNYIYVKGRVSPEQLVEEYKKADIALHVESLDARYRLATRISFSTKIIDLMASSCAILAIAWNQHTGYKYLSSRDAAFCVSDYSQILPLLKEITEHPEQITSYAEKAYRCGVNNHTRSAIQNQILSEFQTIIDEKSSR